jgi:hypothetical protein
MTSGYPRILSVASALPPYNYSQATILKYGLEQILGANWHTRKDNRNNAALITLLFTAAGIEARQSVVDLLSYYAPPISKPRGRCPGTLPTRDSL